MSADEIGSDVSIQSRTPGGALVYCDYLLDKGYATASQVNPWKTAIQKVFETVEGQDWISVDLTAVDLDEYIARFRTLAGAQYKAESITAYARRIHNALDAHEHYVETGRPPSFRQRAVKAKTTEEKPSTSGGSVVPMERKQETPSAASTQPVGNGMMDFPYPLGDGRLVTLRLPSRLKSDDVNRLCAFIRTLQDDSPEARQIPRRTGEEGSQAA